MSSHSVAQMAHGPVEAPGPADFVEDAGANLAQEGILDRRDRVRERQGPSTARIQAGQILAVGFFTVTLPLKDPVSLLCALIDIPSTTWEEGPVGEARQALERSLHGQAKDQLARIVAKLIQSGGALDLKKWLGGIDMTADRAGFVCAHDLETAVEIIKASDESSSAVPQQDRLKELVLYSVSEPYFKLRKKLGISVDS